MKEHKLLITVVAAGLLLVTLAGGGVYYYLTMVSDEAVVEETNKEQNTVKTEVNKVVESDKEATPLKSSASSNVGTVAPAKNPTPPPLPKN